VRLATAAAWVILPIVAGSGLYLLKMQVEAQEQRLASLQRQIAEGRESIHVLNAEWSYLNDPVRLRDQAERLLGMHPIRPDRIVTLDRVPYPDPVPAIAAPDPGSLSQAEPSPAPRPMAQPALAAISRRPSP